MLFWGMSYGLFKVGCQNYVFLLVLRTIWSLILKFSVPARDHTSDNAAYVTHVGTPTLSLPSLGDHGKKYQFTIPRTGLMSGTQSTSRVQVA